MRPDKHKKRKNAAYKKKHGIPSGNGGKPEKNGSTSTHKSGEKAEKPKSDESKVAPEEDNAHEEGESSDHERQSFSRRKIESNWDRYDETTTRDDDFEDVSESEDNSPVLSDVPIEADFQSPHDKATNGGSHFQFQSEKEWRGHSTDLKSNPRKVHHKMQTTSDEKDGMDLLIGINNKELNLTGTRANGSTINKLDTTTTHKAGPAGDTIDDLEDWLDSILD